MWFEILTFFLISFFLSACFLLSWRMFGMSMRPRRSQSPGGNNTHSARKAFSPENSSFLLLAAYASCRNSCAQSQYKVGIFD